MNQDKVALLSYDQLMAEAPAHIEIVIDVQQPIELADFVSAFTAIANQFKRYMTQAHPDLKDDARIFVREVRPGSIIADLVPAIASLITHMDQALIVENFVRTHGERLGKYFNIGGRAEDAGKSELKDLLGGIAAIANDPNGHGRIRAISFEDEKRQIRASVEFDTETAV